MEDFLSDNNDLLVFGDMNINLLNENVCKQYRDLMLINDYGVVKHLITRYASGTLLDHILLENTYKNNAVVCTSKNYRLSDHNFVVILMKITHQSNWIQTTISKLNYPAIHDMLASADFNNIISKCPNVNLAFSEFITQIKSCTENARFTNKIRHKFENEIPLYVDKKYISITNNINNLHDKIRKRKGRNLAVSYLESKVSNFEEILSQYVNMKAKFYYSNIISSSKSFSWNLIKEITSRVKKEEEFVIQQIYATRHYIFRRTTN